MLQVAATSSSSGPRDSSSWLLEPSPVCPGVSSPGQRTRLLLFHLHVQPVCIPGTSYPPRRSLTHCLVRLGAHCKHAHTHTRVPRAPCSCGSTKIQQRPSPSLMPLPRPRVPCLPTGPACALVVNGTPCAHDLGQIQTLSPLADSTRHMGCDLWSHSSCRC